jgi:hypothetical protein
MQEISEVQVIFGRQACLIYAGPGIKPTILWDNATNKLPGRIHIFNRVMPVKDYAP